MNLTKTQSNIWAGQQISPEIPLYNIVFTFDFLCSVDIECFQNAFQNLINNSDTLRLVFAERKGVPSQEILKNLDYNLEVIDWSHKKQPEKKLEQWVNERSQFQFNLSSLCFDSVLIKLHKEHFVWYLCQHHLISDGWSTMLLLEKMVELYQLSLKEKEGKLEKSISIGCYADYVNYENAQITDEKNREKKEYWDQKVKEINNPPSYFKIHPKRTSTKAKRVRKEIEPALTNQLKSTANRSNIRSLSDDLTYLSIFATVFFSYLYRITNQNQLSILFPFHNRTSTSFRNTLGCFIEFYPINLEINSTDTYLSVLDKCKEAILQTLKNVNSGIAPSVAGQKINAIINFINVKSNHGDLPIDINWRHSGHIDKEHALILEIHDFNNTGNYTLDFDLNTSDFPEHVQKQAVSIFYKMLEAFVQDPSGSLLETKILSQEEKQQQLQWGNSNKALPSTSQNIIELFQETVEQHGHRTAVVYETNSITYNQLDSRSGQIASELLSIGSKSKIVGILLERSTEMVSSIYGVLKAGYTYMPIDLNYPDKRIEFMIQNAGCDIIITQKELKKHAGKFDVKKLYIEEINGSDCSVNIAISPITDSYIIYTSGTSGQPKASIVTHQNVVSLVGDLHEAIYERYDDHLNVALVAPIVFDPSVQQLFAATLKGHTLHIVPESLRLDGVGLLDYFQKQSIDITDGTPSHLHLLQLGSTGKRLPKHLIIGGEALKKETLAQFQSHFRGSDSRITNIYGVAECTVDSISYTFDLSAPPREYATVPIGYPLPSERVYILNELLQLQPSGVVGEIHLGGLGVGKGYLNMSDLTSQKFIDNPFILGEKLYRTGDLGRFLPDGSIEYIGRRDSQVKVRGHRIELGEIEEVISSFKMETPQEIDNYSFHSVQRCSKCVLSANHPFIHFDEKGVCNVCRDFDEYKDKSLRYFQSEEDFSQLMKKAKKSRSSEYDCMLLYSGGKDSSYVLYRLVEMGLNVLAFTFDNGFISKAAFDNIKSQTQKLGVDSIIRTTPNMDEIFIESLKSDSTVCSGCFKSLTTISTQIAGEEGINVVITGLSRGQIYDTKLNGLFKEGVFEVKEVENRLAQFRQLFHSSADRTNQLIDIDLRHIDFSQIHFVDYFRYDATPIPDIRAFLKERDSFWRQPIDTGFCSSNCLMNDVGICVHSNQKNYHNYEAPLSWDIRLGISSRNEVLPEVEGEVNIKQVNSILKRIGFYDKKIKKVVVIPKTNSQEDVFLVAYFTSNHKLSSEEIKKYLRSRLPEYMIPSQFIQIEKFPLTTNGKIDRSKLPAPEASINFKTTTYQAPRNDLEELVFQIWQEVLLFDDIGVLDSFFSIGGNSLAAIRITSRMEERLGLEIPLRELFEHPTIAGYSDSIANIIQANLN